MLPTRRRSGSWGQTATPAWQEDWAVAAAAEAAEQRAHRTEWRTGVVTLGLLALAAAVASAVLPLTPGFAASNTLAAALAASLAAAIAVAVAPAAVAAGGTREQLGFAAALASLGAAAVHFAVAKVHFDEYTLFGLFFVVSGLAQLVWPIWWLLRPWRPLLVLGAIGNAAIVALWAVDRIWGLPLGPALWKPDPFGFGDTVASAFELLIVGVCVVLLARRRDTASRRGALTALVVAAFALTTLALMSVIGAAPSLLPPAM